MPMYLLPVPSIQYQHGFEMTPTTPVCIFTLVHILTRYAVISTVYKTDCENIDR